MEEVDSIVTIFREFEWKQFIVFMEKEKGNGTVSISQCLNSYYTMDRTLPCALRISDAVLSLN